MKKLICLYILCLLYPKASFGLLIVASDAHVIAEKIWKNECGGKIEGLTTWNRGEDFASLGIGHFIWYPNGKQERFEEMFPSLLAFIEKQKGVEIPQWLLAAQGCPWHSREEFHAHIQSNEMHSLRQFLFETRDLQAIFIAKRLENTLPLLLEKCSPSDKEKVRTVFYQLAKTSKGLYALIDYLNFKGPGISSKETYHEEGWGLLQVLQLIPLSSKQPVKDFVEAAKTLLARRVKNSPPERGEERWLKGWFNRLDTYLAFP